MAQQDYKLKKRLVLILKISLLSALGTGVQLLFLGSLIPIILCGGTGTSLWPLSRASYPKQYWALTGNSEKTLLQQTQQRLNGLSELGKPLLICHEDHRFIVAEQMRQINVDPTIILEPIGRNTAAAIGVAALKAAATGDFSENAPLDAAREAQGKNEGRIREIEETLKKSRVMDSKSIKRRGKSAAFVGSTIVLKNRTTNKQNSYMLVESSESNPKEGKLSIQSPIGRAVYGMSAGSEVEIQLPNGEANLFYLSSIK